MRFTFDAQPTFAFHLLFVVVPEISLSPGWGDDGGDTPSAVEVGAGAFLARRDDLEEEVMEEAIDAAKEDDVDGLDLEEEEPALISPAAARAVYILCLLRNRMRCRMCLMLEGEMALAWHSVTSWRMTASSSMSRSSMLGIRSLT